MKLGNYFINKAGQLCIIFEDLEFCIVVGCINETWFMHQNIDGWFNRRYRIDNEGI